MPGIFGPGECIDANIRGITNLLDSTNQLLNPNTFVNPQAENIINMVTGATTVRQGVMTYLSGPPPIADLGMLNALDRFQHATDAFTIWTDFISGKSSTFPDAEMAALFNYLGVELPAKWPLLAGFGFVGLMGVATGATQIAYVKCMVDPNDPCQLINKIFGAIMGAVGTVLNLITQGFNLMVDFIGHMLDYIAQIADFIDQIVQFVLNGLNALIEAVVSALRYALAKLLSGLGKHPCMSQILGQIAGADLKVALGIQ